MQKREVPKDDIDMQSADSPHFQVNEIDEDVAAWEEVATGRFMPRRVRGSCAGRALG